jgi:hypothetical protein
MITKGQNPSTNITIKSIKQNATSNHIRLNLACKQKGRGYFQASPFLYILLVYYRL